ncbi:DNA repair protein rad18 [Lophium mytilinum]|uniref:Postreplication repair E3 ubiquitin-protein ligase RAD18 n=1 Tax=Lophium mytilinum TaxID=390894 RepID=A0A6A6QJI0_9PEZI|nr:DNA repair protein rad18 [Lophium mytilinum]
MSKLHAVEDPTDWLNTSLSCFEPLEAALRCQVCKEFYDTPMITTCSHTFCSLCIRRCFNSDGKCPTCRTSDQADKLRRNWVVQELVDTFKAARPAALKLAQTKAGSEDDEAERPKRKRKLEDTDIEEDSFEDTRRPRRTRRSRSVAHGTSQEEPIELDDSGDGDYDPEEGTTLCPICKSRMKVGLVYAHLDLCDGKPVNNNGATRARTQPSKPKEPLPPAARLPQLNYSLLKDNALKKKLQDLGIAAHGSRALIIRRHTEWVNLWNSNCDSSRPRTKRELLRELDSWERSQGAGASTVPSAVMKKDFDGEGWAASNKDQFDELIANARRNRARKEAKTEEREEKPNEDQIDSMPTHQPEQAPSISTPVRHDEIPNPYEGNEKALSIVREKVDEANSHGRRLRSSGQPIPAPPRDEERPGSINEGPPLDEEVDANPPISSQQPSSQFVPISPNVDMSRKAHMFRLPEDPIIDTDGGTSVS